VGFDLVDYHCNYGQVLQAQEPGLQEDGEEGMIYTLSGGLL
jgi:hypothetical protein